MSAPFVPSLTKHITVSCQESAVVPKPIVPACIAPLVVVKSPNSLDATVLKKIACAQQWGELTTTRGAIQDGTIGLLPLPYHTWSLFAFHSGRRADEAWSKHLIPWLNRYLSGVMEDWCCWMKTEVFQWFDNRATPTGVEVPWNSEHMIGEMLTKRAVLRVEWFLPRTFGKSINQVIGLKWKAKRSLRILQWNTDYPTSQGTEKIMLVDSCCRIICVK